MDYVNEFIKNIVVGIILINIVEGFIISKEYEKYVKFFTGLLLIIIMINMGEKICSRVFNISVDTISNDVINSQEENTDKVNKSITNIRDEIYGHYEEKIKYELYNKYGLVIKKIIVKNKKDNKDKINKILIKIEKDGLADREVIEEKIYLEIKNYYNIKREDLRIKFV